MLEPSSPIDDSPPPPAYEFTQREFDQKVANAVEQSLTTPQPDGKGVNYEQWDDAAFEAAVARMNMNSNEGSSSQLASPPQAHASMQSNDHPHLQPQSFEIRPLKIQKKSTPLPPKPHQKERPKWFAEAGLGDDGSSSSRNPPQSHNTRAQPLPVSPSTINFNGHRIPETDEEDQSLPPPPFAHVDTSLDGPAYERVAGQQAPNPGLVLRYAGDNDLSASPPPSPPQSPIRSEPRYRGSSPGPVPGSLSYNHPHHQSAPVPPRRMTPLPAARASTGYVPSFKSPSLIPPPSRLDFDPSVAYSKQPFGQLPIDQLPQGQGASAFYNSSVASHLPSTPQRQPTIQPPRQHLSQVALTQPPDSSPYFSQQVYQAPPRGAMNAYQPHLVSNPAPSRTSYYPTAPLLQSPQTAQPGFSGRSSPMVPENRWATSEAQIQQDMYYRR